MENQMSNDCFLVSNYCLGNAPPGQMSNYSSGGFKLKTEGKHNRAKTANVEAQNVLRIEGRNTRKTYIYQRFLHIVS